MQSIKWCHFQWSWMNPNPNPVFKVTSFFEAEYLTNSYRYSRSYYRRQIGNHTQAFEWHQFQWHWPLNLISRSWYYSTSKNLKMVRNGAIVTMADQYKVICGLSNGAAFNDLERARTNISKSRHSLTPNMSETAKACYKMRIRNRTQLSHGTISNDLEWPLTQISRSWYST